MRHPARGGWRGKSAWSMADNLAQQALSFLIFALLARWLTPHAFGLLAIAHLMVQFVRLTLLDAMALPVVRSPAADPATLERRFDGLFTLCTLTGLLLAALMAAAAPALAQFFGAPELLPVLWGMSGVIVLHGLVRAHEARLLREGKFRVLALRSLVSVSAGGVVALLLAMRDQGALALVAQQLTTAGLALLIALVAQWREWRPRWRWAPQAWREQAAEMGQVSGSALLSYANTNGDAALVSVVLGPQATGLYNLAKRVLGAAYLVIGASLGRVGVSLFVQRQDAPAALGRSYARLLAATLLLLAPLYALATALAEPLVVIVFGAAWRNSAPLFGWLSVACVAQAVFALGQNLSFATGHASRVPRLASSQLVISGLLALAGLRFGAEGVAAGFAAGSVVGLLAMQVAVQRQLRLPWRTWAAIVVPATAAAVAAWATVDGLQHAGLQATGWRTLAELGLAALAAYAVAASVVYRWGRRHLG